MRYQIIYSNDCHRWSEYGSAGTWKEIWALHQDLKALHPDKTYHIIPGYSM